MRNPLDNILSMYRTNFKISFTYSLTDIANFYVYHFNDVQEYKKHYGKIIFEYCYEELIRNLSRMPKIINWLGWQWDDTYLFPHKNKNVFTVIVLSEKKYILHQFEFGRNTKSY